MSNIGAARLLRRIFQARVKRPAKPMRLLYGREGSDVTVSGKPLPPFLPLLSHDRFAAICGQARGAEPDHVDGIVLHTAPYNGRRHE